MKSKSIKKLVGVAVAALLLLVFVVFNQLAELELRTQDAVFQQPGLIHPDIMVIGIDQDALEAFGQWPFPRAVMAEAISILNSYEDARPAVIGVDVMFTEHARAHPEDDAALVEAVRGAGNVVLASSLDIGIDRDSFSLEPTILRHIKPFDGLLPYVSHGIINGIIDDDGFVRNALLWEYFQGEKIYSFPVEVAMAFQGVASPSPFIYDNAYMFIRYTGEPGAVGHNGDFFWFSFADIFGEFFDPAWLADMIVLIGPYDIGMRDHYLVPIMPGAHMYGVEIHANTIQAILDGAYKLRIPHWVGAAIVAVIILAGMAMGEFVDIRITLATFAAVGIGYFFLTQFIYQNNYYVMPVLVPLVVLALIAVYQIIYAYILQTHEKNKLRSTFKKYVDPKLVDALVKSGEADSDSMGRKKHIAVVFVDVRGFTPMTERLRDTPELIVEALNDYLELTSSAVFNNGGSVDKFIGDATMALFNGFVPQEDYVYKAVKAAWDMVCGAEAVNNLIKEKYGIEIGFGIGVHCGDAIVGNLGPSFRKDYTAIGDTVNTAARLESNAKKSQVLISGEVYRLIEDRVQAKSLGEIPLKGKSLPVEIFALENVL